MKRILLKLVALFGSLILIFQLPSDSYFALCLFSFLSVIFITAFIIVVRALCEMYRPKKQEEGMQKNNSNKESPFSKLNYGGIEVSYLRRLNGGGIIFAFEYPRLVAKKFGKVDSIYEYCAGPGFIGFSLLAHGLCDRLTLSEINPDSLAAVQETVDNNNLSEKVAVYESDCLDAIPESEQWDLVVGNQPWDIRTKSSYDIMVHDPGCRVHRKFFADIDRFLKPGGSILFVESHEYSRAEDFKQMIEENGFYIAETFSAVRFRDIFKHLDEYQGTGKCLAMFVRWSMFVREVYFILIKRKEKI